MLALLGSVWADAQGDQAPQTQCSDVNIGQAELKASSFGGSSFCCVYCPADPTKICCPSRDVSGQAITLELDGANPYHKANLCAIPGTGMEGVIKLSGVQTLGPKINLIIKNVTEYSPAWPQARPHKSQHLTPMKGYLFNGRKSDDSLLEDAIQLNVCGDTYVTAQYCFEHASGEAITMERAAIRIFDIDHGKNTALKGPEVVQFKCTGGSFSIFGDAPDLLFKSLTVGKPINVEHGYTKNGLTRTTFACPNDEFVTLWSRRYGDAADNPKNVSMGSLDRLQELSMIMVNFSNVECFNVTFANMPESYHQDRWDMVSRAAGGNPLNSSFAITPHNFPDLAVGECPPGQTGRNFMISGKYDVDYTAPCRGTTFDDPHVQTLSGNRFYMHGIGVFDYASAGGIESQVYLCPFAPCTENMMAKGECLTFIQAVVVRTEKHNLVFRGGKLLVDGVEKQLSEPMAAKDFTLATVGEHTPFPPRINHKDVRDCRPDPASSMDGWLWKQCTKRGWHFQSEELGINVGALGPFEKGWLKEEASDRTFNLDVFNVKQPSDVSGIINGDTNGAFRDAAEMTNTLGVYNAPQVTADNVSPERILFPARMIKEMDAQCGSAKPIKAMPVVSVTEENVRLMRIVA
jgi:hypothetical protein